MFLGRRQWLALAASGLATGCRSMGPAGTAPRRTPYPAFRQAHPSRLVHPAPPPARFDDAALDARFSAVQWAGPLGPMRGWLSVPQGPTPCGALLWLHGAFAASASQLEPLGEAFPPAGWAVFIPAWRGENGNPGERELLAGELDDAIAAVRWLAARPEVDETRMFALGHSVGGGLSALLALIPDLPLRETASVGGIYVPETFVRWSTSKSNGPLVRFDPTDAREGRLRTLEGNIPDLVRPHVAYVGREDTWFHSNVERMREAAERVDAPLTVEYVDGDHMSSLVPGYARYIDRIERTDREAAR